MAGLSCWRDAVVRVERRPPWGGAPPSQGVVPLGGANGAIPRSPSSGASPPKCPSAGRRSHLSHWPGGLQRLRCHGHVERERDGESGEAATGRPYWTSGEKSGTLLRRRAPATAALRVFQVSALRGKRTTTAGNPSAWRRASCHKTTVECDTYAAVAVHMDEGIVLRRVCLAIRAARPPLCCVRRSTVFSAPLPATTPLRLGNPAILCPAG